MGFAVEDVVPGAVVCWVVPEDAEGTVAGAVAGTVFTLLFGTVPVTTVGFVADVVGTVVAAVGVVDVLAWVGDVVAWVDDVPS